MPVVPFGKEARMKIIRKHLAEAGEITPETAWKFIYEELLWIDPSTGLAHLYESDKAQPGRNWYNRTVLFTNLLCEKFGNIPRSDLKGRIDRLFHTIISEILQNQADVTTDDNDITGAFTGTQADSQIIEEIVEAVESTLVSNPLQNIADEDLVVEFMQIIVRKINLDRQQAERLAQTLVKRARFYYTIGNKRQNVLGEGFEDLLQVLMITVSKVPTHRIVVRQRANKLPGFKSRSNRKREEAPDIAVVNETTTQLLASVKWSIRHDRQKQFSDELDSYAELIEQDSLPAYVVITNEYDPGRLINICNLEPHKGLAISCIYHINPELLLGVLSSHNRLDDIKLLINSGKIRSVADFLSELLLDYGVST